MAKAYAYVRCASVSQNGASESLFRQLELSQKYAKENGLELVETVQDAGVSGYRNRTEGALAALVGQIESGAIEPGSYLLIESLDRLRHDLDEFERLKDPLCGPVGFSPQGLDVPLRRRRRDEAQRQRTL